MAAAPLPRTKVFISYSHADRDWLERLKRHVKPLVREGRLECWDDTHIRPGDDWKQEIRTALETAQVAVLLISADFFASDFIDENELPSLLDAAKAKGVRILPVIISASRFARSPDLARFQAVNSPDRPLDEMPPDEQERVLDRLTKAIESISSAVPTRQTASNRHRMLELVRKNWIDGYLKNSLQDLACIELGLEERPDAVSWPWDPIVQQPGRGSRPLPPGRPMSAVFDELGQSLLILGAPGTGKTTLLLELARDLLGRAEQDASYPMPVVFHLSSWAVRRRPLADWLADELTERYFVSRKLARAWTDAEQVLPLLDGLDEVAQEHRAACAEAINTFRSQHGSVPLAVCSRAADYQALPVRLELSGAVAIAPLSRAQVNDYLKQAGEPLAGVRAALRDDEALLEMLETPLMLSIVALAYRGWSMTDVRALGFQEEPRARLIGLLAYRGRLATPVRAFGSLDSRRAHLFAAYTEAMFERRTRVTGHTREQTVRWLAWLARSLMHNDLSIFYVEGTQPDWLPTRAQRLIVATVPSVLCGLGWGLASYGGLAAHDARRLWARQLPYEVAYKMAYENALWGIWLMVGGLVTGLIFGLLGGLAGALDRITPSETLWWSWREALGGLRGQMPRSALVATCLFVALFALLMGLEGGLAAALATVLIASSPLLVPGLMAGLTTGQISLKTAPNEGIRRSLRNALISFLVAWLLVGLVVALPAIGGQLLSFWHYPDLWEHLSIALELVSGLSIGLTCGAIVGTRNGGFACLQHYSLRLLLWCNGYAPWNYIQFLDHAVERVFLRKAGGGYIFTHRLLMEYFATLEPFKPERSR